MMKSLIKQVAIPFLSIFALLSSSWDLQYANIIDFKFLLAIDFSFIWILTYAFWWQTFVEFLLFLDHEDMFQFFFYYTTMKLM